MAKIEAMTEAEMVELLKAHPPAKVGHYTFQRLIAAYIKAQAKAEMAIWELNHLRTMRDDRHYWTDTDWQRAVAERVGWRGWE